MRFKTASRRRTAAATRSAVRPASRLHQILLAHADGAIDALASASVSDEAVHTARKEIKRARAAARLLRTRIGKTRYQRENTALRDAARPLTGTRDAKVVLDTLRRVLNGAGKRSNGAFADARVIVENGIARESAAATRERSASAQASLRTLRLARNRIQRWQLAPDDWFEIGPAFALVYKRAQRAYKIVVGDPSAENLHEWRKHVKYLWHALQFIEAQPDSVPSMAASAHKLADLLGDDHDLAVLAERLSASRVPNARKLAKDLVPVIDKRRSKLERKAFKLGAKLFAERPRAIEARIGKRFCNTGVMDAP